MSKYQATYLTRVILKTSKDKTWRDHPVCPLHTLTKESLSHFILGGYTYTYPISLSRYFISLIKRHTSHRWHSNNGLGKDWGTLTNIFKAYCAMSS